jgi:hypothetical protein
VRFFNALRHIKKLGENAEKASRTLVSGAHLPGKGANGKITER